MKDNRYVGSMWLGQGHEVFIEQDNEGKTALMWVSENGHVEVVKVLLDAGAKIDEKNNDVEKILSYFGIKVEMLNRFKSSKEQKQILKSLYLSNAKHLFFKYFILLYLTIRNINHPII